MIIQLIAGASIVILVMLQHGQGADAGAGFGAGASGTVFGARGATTALSRATAIFAAIFMLNSVLLTYLSTRAPEHQKTILDLAGQTHGASAKAPATAAPQSTGAAGKPSGPGAPTPSP
ncbi:MAG: preprotein translocase subunit SecG [Steroidobacteraceae bacterium]